MLVKSLTGVVNTMSKNPNKKYISIFVCLYFLAEVCPFKLAKILEERDNGSHIYIPGTFSILFWEFKSVYTMENISTMHPTTLDKHLVFAGNLFFNMVHVAYIGLLDRYDRQVIVRGKHVWHRRV